MFIYLYSLPALVAFVAKGAMLFYWRAAAARDIRTRLFVVAVVVSMGMNVIEFTGLQGYWGDAVSDAGYAYNALLPVLLAVLTHLTIWIAYEEVPAPVRRWLIPSMYGYLLSLLLLLLGSSLVIAGFEQFGGYSITRVPGPLYPLFEVFGILALVTTVVLPIRGILQKSDGRLRSRCQIWMLAAVPACALVITVLVLLRLNVRWFNATVTLPIPMMLLLASIGYCIHNRRIIDLSAVFPFTQKWRAKQALHESLAAVTTTTIPVTSVARLLENLSQVLACPIHLVGPSRVISTNGVLAPNLADIPLAGIGDLVVSHEASEPLKGIMRQNAIGAIAPLFATSEIARHWLIFGETFTHHIYTPRDFQTINRVVRLLAGLILDTLAENSHAPDGHPADIGEVSEISALHTGSLYARLAEYEGLLINEALARCTGNQAQAARLLGLKPNTLHYKLRRLGLVK